MGYWLEVLKIHFISYIQYVWGNDYLLLVRGGILRQILYVGALIKGGWGWLHVSFLSPCSQTCIFWDRK